MALQLISRETVQKLGIGKEAIALGIEQIADDATASR
jgi:hypothetical protein